MCWTTPQGSRKSVTVPKKEVSEAAGGEDNASQKHRLRYKKKKRGKDDVLSLCGFWKHLHANASWKYISTIWKRKRDSLHNISPNYHALKSNTWSLLYWKHRSWTLDFKDTARWTPFYVPPRSRHLTFWNLWKVTTDINVIYFWSAPWRTPRASVASLRTCSCSSWRALGEHSLGLLDANQVVYTDRPPHCRFTQVLVLVLAQPGDGLEKRQKYATVRTQNISLGRISRVCDVKWDLRSFFGNPLFLGSPIFQLIS